MIISESYKKRIQELANIIEENRLQKLVDQKFPENIIKFAKEFASKTTKEPVTDDKINKNQYIPWIASELKRDISIAEEEEKLLIIINWIKHSGYNKIPSNIPFEQVYDKAKSWLEKNTIDTKSGEKIEGGNVIHTFSNGSKIIKVNDANWCMKIGEKKGWCFNSEDTAKIFVGLDKLSSEKEGYMIVDKNKEPTLAIQYDKSTGVIDDYQGTFNKIPAENVTIDSIELLKQFPIIKDIKGHRDTLLKTIKKYPRFFELFKELKNLSIPLEKKWNLRIPFTKEEVANMNVADRYKYGLLNKKEINKLSSFVKKILFLINNPTTPDKKSLFTTEELGYHENDFKFNKENVEIDITEEEFEKHYDGLGDEDAGNRWFYKIVNSYDYYEDVDIDEMNYMYSYINEENKKKLKQISKIIGLPSYDFSDESGIYSFTEKYFTEEIKNTIIDDFLSNYSYALEDARKKAVIETVDEEQKFKYYSSVLVLPYKELYSFLVLNNEKYITSFIDLEEAEINGEIELEDTFYGAFPEVEGLTQLNRDFSNSLGGFIELLEDDESFSKINKSITILKNLKFNDNNVLVWSSKKYGRGKNDRTIKIEEIDFTNEKYLINYYEYPKTSKIDTSTGWSSETPTKKLSGWVKFDNLTNYINSSMLFEIRKIIRNELKAIDL